MTIRQLKGSYKFNGKFEDHGYTASIQFEHDFNQTNYGPADLFIPLLALNLSEDFYNHGQHISFAKTSADIYHNLGVSVFEIGDEYTFKDFVDSCVLFVGTPLAEVAQPPQPAEKSANSTLLRKPLRVQGNYSFKINGSENYDNANKIMASFEIIHKINLAPGSFLKDDLQALRHKLNLALFQLNNLAGILGIDGLHFEAGRVEIDLGTGTRIFPINDLNSFAFFVTEYNKMLGLFLAESKVKTEKQSISQQQPEEDHSLNQGLNPNNAPILVKYRLKADALERTIATVQNEAVGCYERCMTWLGYRP
jgi:hypothetical protein